MKKVTLRRKELLGHLPKEVRVTAKTKLGSVYVGRQPLRGVEGEEEKRLLDGILDVGPTHSDWPKQSKLFWAVLSNIIGLPCLLGTFTLPSHSIL